jgi:uncharacterized protein YbjT (DUF2867 family)
MHGDARTIVVTGATGRQGGAVARHLVADGWRVRCLTRHPDSDRARSLATLGAEVVAGDMADPIRMRQVCDGAHGVFSVQNPMSSGEQDELGQGRVVVDAAADAGVSHLVYGSAGPGTPSTGVRAWDDKLEVAAHARDRGVPLTVLRSMAFMELMTDRDLYPAVAVWHLMPRLVGEDRPLPWLSAQDVGAVVARAFADPSAFVGKDLGLAADVRSLGECRDTWRRVTGRNPRRFPMPAWLFRRFTGDDLLRMWRWLGTHDVTADTEGTRAIHPGALTLEQFVELRAGGPRPAAGGEG